MTAAQSRHHGLEADHATTIHTKLQNALQTLQQQESASPPISPQTVYIVTDTCYPTARDFDTNKGTFNIDSVHSTKKSANARAKKIIFRGGQCKVDVDKIIEEVTEERGLYTGIGIGEEGTCYARKCGVESKIVDEDSEDEAEEELNNHQEERERSCCAANAADNDGDGDIQMT